MTTKHFFSNPDQLVSKALNSITLTNPSLAFDPENKIIFRRPDVSSSNKVSIVSGGGSGHEPAFAGLVGKGLLRASVAGTIFASPSAEQIRRAAMDRIDTGSGVLIIPNNYTGDVLNFGMAAEKLRAAGVKTEFFAINDDVGVGRAKSGKVGRRGIAGGILLLKIVGALAEAGGSLEDVHRIAKLTNENLVSLGSSLQHVHIPGREVAEDTVPPGEVEVGMGIHNEPGSHHIKADFNQLVDNMLHKLLDTNDTDRAYLSWKPEDQFVLLINNLGGLSTLELSGITDEVYQQLSRVHKIRPVRVIQGTFLTSLNQLGFSISLLKLVDTGLGAGKSMLELFDAPAEAVGYNAPISPSTWEKRTDAPVELKRTTPAEEQPSNVKLDPTVLKNVLIPGLKRLISAEPQITRYDTTVGDGDCGIGLKRGAEAVIALLENPSTKLTDDVVNAVNQIVTVVENTMDGTSGAIYAIFLNALAHGLREQAPSTSAPITVTVDTWSKALGYSLTALAKYTPAKPGDRTMIDALVPFATTLLRTKDARVAAKAAQESADDTKNMTPKLGRTVYVGGQDEWIGKIPDPGAYGLGEFLAGLAAAA